MCVYINLCSVLSTLVSRCKIDDSQGPSNAIAISEVTFFLYCHSLGHQDFNSNTSPDSMKNLSVMPGVFMESIY